MNQAFQFFLASCDSSLDFLITEHAFHKLDPDIYPPECSIRYKLGKLTIEVVYEYDDFPWIRISSTDGEFSLDSLIKRHCPRFRINRKRRLGTDQKVSAALDKYSSALKEELIKDFIKRS